jgi:hypothetical protein
MKIGDTFVWFPPDDRKEHLFIVLTDPQKNDGNFAVFNLTKSHGGPMALTFRVGQHPFIDKYDSDVNFGDSLVVNIATIEVLIRRREVIPNKPMNMSMVEMIAKKAVGHPAVSGDVEELVKGQWGL